MCSDDNHASECIPSCHITCRRVAQMGKIIILPLICWPSCLSLPPTVGCGSFQPSICRQQAVAGHTATTVDLLLCRLPTPISLIVNRRAVLREMRAKVAILLTVAVGAPPSISVAGDPIPATTTPYTVESNAADPYRNHRRDLRRHELKFSARRLARPIPANRRPDHRHCHQHCDCSCRLYPHVPSNWPLTTIVADGARRLQVEFRSGPRRPPCRKFTPAHRWRSGFIGCAGRIWLWSVWLDPNHLSDRPGPSWFTWIRPFRLCFRLFLKVRGIFLDICNSGMHVPWLHIFCDMLHFLIYWLFYCISYYWMIFAYIYRFNGLMTVLNPENYFRILTIC